MRCNTLQHAATRCNTQPLPAQRETPPLQDDLLEEEMRAHVCVCVCMRVCERVKVPAGVGLDKETAIVSGRQILNPSLAL